MLPDLPIPVYSSDQFSWFRNKGAADASDLECGGSQNVASQVYSDACDIGFYIVSAKTGAKVLFCATGIDGLLSDSMEFSSGDYSVTVFND